MKKFAALIFAFAMMLSIVFIGDAVSSNAPFSANAMTAQVKVRHRRHGVARRYYHHSANGVRYGAHKTKRGTKWTAHKTKRGTQYTYHKTKRGTKYTYRKIKRSVQ